MDLDNNELLEVNPGDDAKDFCKQADQVAAGQLVAEAMDVVQIPSKMSVDTTNVGAKSPVCFAFIGFTDDKFSHLQNNLGDDANDFSNRMSELANLLNCFTIL